MLQRLTLDFALSSVTTERSMDVKHLLSSETAALVCPASSTTSVLSASSTSSNKVKRGWVAPFLLHLHQMLRREDSTIIRWAENGIAFQILDKEAMASLVLPKYFKNKNFSSFQRQLNYFGFRKWSKARAPFPTYSREHFTRDDYNQMSLVKRQSKQFRKRRVASDTKPSAISGTIVLSTKAIASDKGSQHLGVDPETVIIPVPQLQSCVVSPTIAPAFLFPVLSPTRKMNSSSKLPSIRELSLSSVMSHAGIGQTRPRLLA
uniref:HSF-type DNA-binding domain-containing protein n=1 Tax=Hyaloperonospora arabidopsidis (strain Emoy2) TaxID=559515 RepID=M4C0H9_HYAAE